MFEIVGLIFPKIIFFQDVPIHFLIFFEVFWYNSIIKVIDTGSRGPDLAINKVKI